MKGSMGRLRKNKIFKAKESINYREYNDSELLEMHTKREQKKKKKKKKKRFTKGLK